ncbi:MAG: hypothetical protein AAGC91_12180 [Pseudomonadota bacterium]
MTLKFLSTTPVLAVSFAIAQPLMRLSISAIFTTESNQNFAVSFGDVALSQIALGEEVETGRVSATVPVPQPLYLTAFVALILVRRRGPQTS